MTPTDTLDNTLAEPTPITPPAGTIPPVDPLDQEEANYQKSVTEWQQKASDSIDKSALDPDTFYKGKDLTFARTTKEGQMLATNDSFLQLANDGEPIPPGLNRDLFRQEVAYKLFEGKGADSEEAFHAEIVKSATDRKNTKELFSGIGEEAAKSVTTGAIGEQSATFQSWREEAQKHPGYKANNDADYLEAWNDTQREAKARMEPFRDELAAVWKGWKDSEGAGKVVGVAKGLASDIFTANPDGFTETAKEMAKKSTRQTAFEIYDKLPADQRENFMGALASMAASIPKDEKPAFFANIAKSTGRDWETLAQQSKTGAVSLGRGSEDFMGGGAFLGKKEREQMATERKAAETKYRSQADFVQKVQNLQEGTYDPVKKISSGWWGKLGETVAYGTPGVLATSFAASNPYTGAALFSSLTENHYQSMLQAQQEAGISYEKASEFATSAAPVGAALETVSEMLGSRLLRGKMPFLDKALTGAMDKLANPLARGAARFVAGGIEEGGLEVAQNYIDAAVWEVGNGFKKDTGVDLMPSIQENIDTFVQILPLALFGVAGAGGHDARVKAFAEASDLQLKSVGYTSESVGAIREGIAKGLNSGAEAISAQDDLRVPESDEAKAAIAELDAQVEAQKKDAQAAQLSGVLPSFTRTADGWSVRDGETGKEIGREKDIAGALRLAAEHSSAIDENNADQTAFLATMLQAGEMTTHHDNENRNTGFEFTPGQKGKFTANDEEVISDMELTPKDEARILAQSKAKGGIFTGSILGQSVTEFKQKVRNTVNKITGSGSVLTVFHEEAHGFFEEAIASGRLTKEGTIETIRGIQSRFSDEKRHFIPATGEVSNVQLQEGVSKLMETLVLKNRKKTGYPTGMVSKNLTAIAKRHAGAKTFKAFADTVRDFFGITLHRAVEMRQAIRSGHLKEADIEAFTSKLFGLDQQDEHDAAAVEHAGEILNGGAFSIAARRGENIEETDSANPQRVEPRNKVEAPDQVEAVAKIYAENGKWVGRPLLAIDDGNGGYQALTGSHRLAAAVEAELDSVPIVSIDINALGEWWQENPSNIVVDAYGFANNTREEDQLLALKEAKQDGFEADWLDRSIELLEMEDDSNLLDREDRASFSLGPARMSDALADEAISRIKDPKQKRAIMDRIAANMAQLSRVKDEIGVAFGKSFTRKAIEDPRSKASINKESAFREAARRAELDDQVHAKYGDLLNDDDLVKVKAQRAHELLSVTRADGSVDPLRGRLMSSSQAASRGENFFDAKKQGDYDGSGNVSRTVFGGNLTPDQAAQEMFDAGIIKEPTPDAMWKALEREQNSVARMKEHMVKAKEELQAARQQAKSEAAQWKAARLKEESANYSPKAKLLRAMAMLDGIISALPIAERGRIGGYTQLATLGTDEARLKFLTDRIAKADQVVENYLKKEYGKMLDSLMDRAEAVRESGKKPRGKLGAEGHRYFDKVKEVVGMSDKEVESAQDALDKEIASTDQDDIDELVRLGEDYQILSTFGNFKDKSAAEMAAAMSAGQAVFDTHRNKWRITEESRLRGVRDLTNSGIDNLGNPDGGDLLDARERAKTMGGKVYANYLRGLSFPQLLAETFGKGSKIAERWSKMTRDGFRQATSGRIAAERRWQAAGEAATGLKGRKARYRVSEMSTERNIKATVAPMQTEKIKVPIDTFFDSEKRSSLGLSDEEVAKLTEQFDNLPEIEKKDGTKTFQGREFLTLERDKPGKSHSLSLTEAEGIFLSMTWAQEEYQPGMRLHGMGEDFQAELEAGLSDAAKSLRGFLASEYAGNFEPLRSLVARMYGVDLTQTKNYSRGVFFNRGTESGMTPDGGKVMEGGMKQKFLKQRTKHTAETKVQDAFDIYFDTIAQTEHWKGLAEVCREMSAVIGDPKMKKALEARSPDLARELSQFLKAIEGNGLSVAGSGSFVRAVSKAVTYQALAFKLSATVKNLFGALVNPFYAMDAKDVLVGYSRLAGGKIDYQAIFKSDIIQNRINEGSSPELRAILTGATKPGLRDDFLKFGMKGMGYADAIGTSAAAAVIFDHHFRVAKRTMTSEAAAASAIDKTAEIISRITQPVEVADKSLMEMSMNPLTKLATFAFRSEARQKSMLTIEAWKNTFTGKATRDDVRVLVASHLIMSPLMWAISAAISDIRDPDDDKWFDSKHWNLLDLGASITVGPMLSGIFLGSEIMDEVMSVTTGKFYTTNSLISSPYQGFKALKDLFSDKHAHKDAAWYESRITKVIQGTMIPVAGAGASIIDQLWDYGRSAKDTIHDITH